MTKKRFKKHSVNSRHLGIKTKIRKILNFRMILKAILTFIILISTGFALIVVLYCFDLPDVSNLFSNQKKRNITLIDNHKQIISTYGEFHSNFIEYHSIPKHLREALLATEDRRFFQHGGIDYFGIIRALLRNIVSGRVMQGGSTLTQQLAKIAFLTQDRNIKRKIQELILSIYLESHYSKQEIMSAYLTRAYFGSGVYGAAAAAKYYFEKNLSQLNLLESAILVGMLKAPTKYSPANDKELSGKRAYQVLLNMQKAGYITHKDINKALSEKVILRSPKKARYGSYFFSYVYNLVNLTVPDMGENLIVTITVDKKLEENCSEILNNFINKFGVKNRFSQGAIVVLDKGGKIISMVGGKNYEESNFNRAADAMRQPGSAFKHVVYLNAIMQGANPEDIYEDKAVHIGKWYPRNNDGKFHGKMSLKEAFSRSINTIAVQLSEKYNRRDVIELAEEIGIDSHIGDSPSLALGSFETSLLNLTSSYSIYVNNGLWFRPYTITSIKTDNGKEMLKHVTYSKKVATEKEIAKMRNMLIATVNEGSGKNAKVPGHMVGGKTGTSQFHRDAWFIGFIGEYTIGVWLGNDDNSPMNKVGGSGIPAEIFAKVAKLLAK